MKSPVKKFYYDDGLTGTWDKFIEICRREGSSASKKLREFIIEYVADHEPGNPQLKLDRVLEDGGPRGPVCDVCGQVAKYRVNLPGRQLYRCRQHKPRPREFQGPWGYGEI